LVLFHCVCFWVGGGATPLPCRGEPGDADAMARPYAAVGRGAGSESATHELADELDALPVHKDDVGWPLELLEQAALAAAAEEAEAAAAAAAVSGPPTAR